MSLYNMLHGQNPLTGLLLAVLGNPEIPRLRDTHITDGEICIYTRAGGNNRESYEDEIAALQQHPLYVGDENDDFDCTYATFRFKIPDEYAFLKVLDTGKEGTPRAKWDQLWKDFNSGKPLEQILKPEALTATKELMRQLNDFLTGAAAK